MHWDRLEYTSLLHLWRVFFFFFFFFLKVLNPTSIKTAGQLSRQLPPFWHVGSRNPWKEAVHFAYKYSSQIYAKRFPAWWKVENGNAISSCPVSWPSSISPTSPSCPPFPPSWWHVDFRMLVWLWRRSLLFLPVHPLILKCIYSHVHCPQRPLRSDQTPLLLWSLTK